MFKKIFFFLLIINELSSYQILNKPTLIGTLSTHTSSIRSLFAFPNGFLASSSEDYSIKIWNSNNGSLIRTLIGSLLRNISVHSQSILCLSILPNGLLASGAKDGTIKIWDSNTGSLVKILVEQNEPIYSLTIFKNGYLAYSDTLNEEGNSTIRSMNILQNGNLVSGLDAPKTMVDTITMVHPCKIIKLWSPNLDSLIRTLSGHTDKIKSLAILTNGILASGSNDQDINLWNVRDGFLIRKLSSHNGAINSLLILQNGFLASASEDGTIKVWNPYNGTLFRTNSVLKALYIH
ncbi:unnamed protein product [Brachionus calyciflorus]|uniref:Uncharacterized protein n=1 Tax=Brachionus calyciflorus TaxID=104777 RepID=A0A813SVZ3_9BILA|nr:unnamed protein product [Brachionus calyciflorus]